MNITYSEYEAKDFLGYTNCLNGLYHGNHPYPLYFNKEFLQNLIDKGELIITLAKTEDGKVVGTSVAQLCKGTFENSVMLGLRCVDSNYQGMGIGKNQETFLFDLIKKRFGNAKSFYADVVTNNVYSQNTLVKKGFVFCGMNMMFFREPSYKSTYEEDDYKLSMAIYAKANLVENVEIYPPKQYADMLKAIYDSLNVKTKFLTGKAIGETEFTYETLEKHDTSEFFVKKVGADTHDLISKIKEHLKKGNVVSVYMNMKSAGSEELAEELEKLDFYFCGTKPLNENGEYLLMCQTKNHKGDYRNIQVPNESKQLVDLIIGGAK